MTRVIPALPLRSRLLRAAAALLATVQLCLAVAAAVEPRGESAAHVEAAGVRQHHAHVEAGCPVCTANLVPGHPQSTPAAPTDDRDGLVPAPRVATDAQRALVESHSPRGPPLVS
jgi:hypothetical protein